MSMEALLAVFGRHLQLVRLLLYCNCFLLFSFSYRNGYRPKELCNNMHWDKIWQVIFSRGKPYFRCTISSPLTCRDEGQGQGQPEKEPEAPRWCCHPELTRRRLPQSLQALVLNRSWSSTRVMQQVPFFHEFRTDSSPRLNLGYPWRRGCEGGGRRAGSEGSRVCPGYLYRAGGTIPRKPSSQQPTPDDRQPTQPWTFPTLYPFLPGPLHITHGRRWHKQAGRRGLF